MNKKIITACTLGLAAALLHDELNSISPNIHNKKQKKVLEEYLSGMPLRKIALQNNLTKDNIIRFLKNQKVWKGKKK